MFPDPRKGGFSTPPDTASNGDIILRNLKAVSPVTLQGEHASPPAPLRSVPIRGSPVVQPPAISSRTESNINNPKLRTKRPDFVELPPPEGLPFTQEKKKGYPLPKGEKKVSETTFSIF